MYIVSWLQASPSQTSQKKVRPNITPTRNKPKTESGVAYASITIEDAGAGDQDYELGPGGIVKLR